jgi:hypothetical protein
VISRFDRHRERGGHHAGRALVLPEADHFVHPSMTPTTVDRGAALICGGSPEDAQARRAAARATLALLESALRPGA